MHRELRAIICGWAAGFTAMLLMGWTWPVPVIAIAAAMATYSVWHSR